MTTTTTTTKAAAPTTPIEPRAFSLVERLATNPPDTRLRATMAALLASGVLVAGCSQMTEPSDIATANELCSKRGGFVSVSRYEHGRNLIINCKDGAHLDVRLHDVNGANQ